MTETQTETAITCNADTPRAVRVRPLPDLGAIWLYAPPAGDEAAVHLRLDKNSARALRDALNAFLGA